MNGSAISYIMAKRLIDTNLFKSGRLKRLKTPLKLFYVYLLLECDHAGVWDVELDVAELRIGMELPPENEILQQLEGFAIPFNNGQKWFLPNFIFFQYGELNPNNRVHSSVLDILNKHNINHLLEPQEAPSKPLTSPLDDPNKPLASPILGAKDKDKDKEKDKDKDKDMPKKKSANAPNPAFIAVYSQFMEARNLKARLTATDAKSLRLIENYLSTLESATTGKKTALELFQFILDNWQHLNPWQQSQLQPRQINAQLPNFIETIKQHYNGTKTNGRPDHAREAAELSKFLREKLGASGAFWGD